jgi:hypothetical protein
MRPEALGDARRRAARLVAPSLWRGGGMVDAVPALPDAAA